MADDSFGLAWLLGLGVCFVMIVMIANKTFTNHEDGSSPDEHPQAHFQTVFGKLGNSKP